MVLSVPFAKTMRAAPNLHECSDVPCVSVLACFEGVGGLKIFGIECLFGGMWNKLNSGEDINLLVNAKNLGRR